MKILVSAILITLLMGCEPVTFKSYCKEMPKLWCVNKCLYQHEERTNEPINSGELIQICRDMADDSCYSLRFNTSIWDDEYKCHELKKGDKK